MVKKSFVEGAVSNVLVIQLVNSSYPDLVNQERFELDPESLEDVLKIQIDSSLREADTPEKLALMYVLSSSESKLLFYYYLSSSCI